MLALLAAWAIAAAPTHSVAVPPETLPSLRELIDIQIDGPPRTLSVDGEVQTVTPDAADPRRWQVVVKPTDDRASVAFKLILPKQVRPPFEVTQRIRMDLSSLQMGFSSWETHATITDGDGRPLLFVNEPPSGWLFVPGDLEGPSPVYPWAMLRRTRVRAPDGWETSLIGWTRWNSPDSSFLVCAFAEAVDAGAEVPPDWSPLSRFSGIRQ